MDEFFIHVKQDAYRRDKHSDPKTRKAFSYLIVGLSSATGIAGVKNTIIHLVSQWNPSADVMALANIEVDLSPIAEVRIPILMFCYPFSLALLKCVVICYARVFD